MQVPAAEAYGDRDPEQVQRVKRTLLPVEGELQIGETFRTGEDRQAPVVTVVAIEGDEVLLELRRGGEVRSISAALTARR